MLAVSTAVGASAGLILPVAIALAPVSFDPRGFGPAQGQVGPHLIPPLTGAALITIGAAVFGLTATLGSRWRREATREAAIAIAGSVTMLLAAAVALAPESLGAKAAADASARGLGALFGRGGPIPSPTVLIALAFATLQTVGLAFVVTAVGDLLRRIGYRSETYAHAGQGLQGSKPVVFSGLIALLMSVEWLAATIVRGRGGAVDAALDAVAWPILWLTAAAATTLGGGYLAVNAIWALTPWRRPVPLLDALIGPAPEGTATAASMADPDTEEDAP